MRWWMARCYDRYQVYFAEMLCIPEPQCRLQDRSWHVALSLYQLQQSRDIHGHIRGDIRGRLFRQRVRRQPNDKRGPLVIGFKQRRRRAIGRHHLQVLGMPVERPSVRSSSFRNSSRHRLR